MKTEQKTIMLRRFAVAAAVLFAAVLVFTAPGAGAIDTGWYYDNKDTDIFEIRTLDELRGLASLVNGDNDNIKTNFAGKTIILLEDITLKEGGALNIGLADDDEFCGTFDGGNHKIKGFSIPHDLDSKILFGNVGEGAVIKNLSVTISTYVDPSPKVTHIASSECIGFVQNNHGSIENCYSEIEIRYNLQNNEKHSNSRKYLRFGGIAGINYGTIKNCYATGTIEIITDTYKDAKSRTGFFGGICGMNQGKISECYFIGDITVTTNYYKKDDEYSLGGICGKNNGIITDCYFAGDIKIANKYEQRSLTLNAGGICGSNSKSIDNCYFVGEIDYTGNIKNNNINLGGISGANSDGEKSITNSYSIGYVTKEQEYYGITNDPDSNTVDNCYFLHKSDNNDENTGICVVDVWNNFPNGKWFDSNWKTDIWKLDTTSNYRLPTLSHTPLHDLSIIDPEHLKVTVNFDSNGGTDIPDKITLFEGGCITILPNPQRIGYTFQCWSTEKNQKKSWEMEKTVHSDMTLYAYWKPNEYTITFDTDGGTEVNPIKQDYGTAVTKPADPTKEGYTFAGWDKEIPATMPAEDMKITAQWTINQYTITFDTDGGAAVDSITQDYGNDVTPPADPTKEGYTFAGWDKTIPTTMPAENVTITAKWTINQYTITFDTNGGTAVAPITQNYGTAVTEPADPTKTGYTFAGWEPVIPATMPAENVTITAQWTINQYTITFVTDGGTEIPAISQIYGTDVPKPENPTRDGYTFKEWDSQIPTTMPAENTVIKAQWTINQYTITFDTDGGSAVAPITQDYNTAVTVPADPTKTGYTFAGWEPEIPATMPAEDKTIKAQWKKNEVPSSSGSGGGKTPTTVVIPVTPPEEPDTPDRGDEDTHHTITFNANGGTGVMNPQNVEMGETITLSENAFTRNGYTFKGWTLIQGTAVDFPDGAAFTPESNVTLYAVWEENPDVTTGFPLWLLLLICGLLIAAVIGTIVARKTK